MKGIQTLINMRMSGVRPDSVWIDFDNYTPPKYEQEFKHLHLGYAPTYDYRPFVGLDVYLFSGSGHEKMADVLEGLKPYAKQVALFVADYGEDIGFIWTREGEIHFG